MNLIEETLETVMLSLGTPNSNNQFSQNCETRKVSAQVRFTKRFEKRRQSSFKPTNQHYKTLKGRK